MWGSVLLASFASSAWGQLKSFPLSANQSGTVVCLQNPSISYDIYLPPGYSTNGAPCPILYTLSPNGGGEVSDFQSIGQSLNMIIVGLLNSKDDATWDVEFRDFYEVPLDIRQRVLFDPAGVFVAGLSGGGECSYVFARFFSQHVSGVLAMGGWLGRDFVVGYLGALDPPIYYSTDRLQTNLLVARTTGTTDAAAAQSNPYDSNFLWGCGAVVKDWSFSGGDQVPPNTVRASCLEWLLNTRTSAGIHDQSNALVQAANWRSQIPANASAVLKECVATIINQPRSWFALEAQLVMDDLMTNYNTFRALDVSNLFSASSAFTTNIFGVNSNGWVNYWSSSDFASDLFYYTARSAATNNDWARYDACLKALNGVAGVNRDRYGDIFNLLVTNGYPAPILQIPPGSGATPLNVWLQEDTFSLNYNLQFRFSLTANQWMPADPFIGIRAFDTNTIWLAVVLGPPGNVFYRMETIPVQLGTSPPLPE